MPRPKATPWLLAPTTAVTLLSLHLLPPIPRFESRSAAHLTAKAHTVEIVEDIGATLHIEPNDTPRAGEEVLAWFALTRRGGETIPLADCDCALSIYTQPKTDASILSPALSAIDAEGYEDIPSARFTFPNVGAYSLVISGSPKQSEDFTPFELSFDVTVAAGQAVADQPLTDSAQDGERNNAQDDADAPAKASSSSEGDTPPAAEETAQGLPKSTFFGFIGLSVIFLLGYAFVTKQNKQQP